jgi:hypothetical protein
VNELAQSLESGDLAETDRGVASFAVMAFISSAEENTAQVSPPDALSAQWDRMLVVHEHTKDAFARWYEEEIDSAELVDEMRPILEDAEAIALDAENVLGKEYGVDSELMTEQRNEAMEMVNDVFEVLDTTPSP